MIRHIKHYLFRLELDFIRWKLEEILDSKTRCLKAYRKPRNRFQFDRWDICQPNDLPKALSGISPSLRQHRRKLTRSTPPRQFTAPGIPTRQTLHLSTSFMASEMLSTLISPQEELSRLTKIVSHHPAGWVGFISCWPQRR